ncbi:hypothetical protein BGX27_008057 [Mortierella sp. AM989]|nr:hypothetical protein BGX27_008057 [Mortierella sp. AM989]
MVVLGENIGERMDRFVQTKSRWMIDPIGGSGYELLTSTTDSDRLTLQKELDQSQHKCSNFFYGIISQNGFGSHWHTLGLGLAHTLHYNMTLFTVKTYKNFIPLTTCTRTNLDRAFSEYPPETDFSRWDSSTINFKSVGNEHGDVHALMANVNIINPEFQHRGHFWWRSMLTYYAIRPNFKIREMMRQSSPVATPCISIHVRHSDKLEEAPPIALSEYMKHAYQVKEKTGISNIYLMSDDQQVIEGSKDFPDFQFRYLDMPRSNRGWLNDRKEGMSMDSMERNFLIDILSAAQCQHMVLTYSSNVGRLMAEIAFALQDTEPVVVSLDVPNWVASNPTTKFATHTPNKI